jgi:hypothetical protein
MFEPWTVRRVTRFTEIVLRARLTVPRGTTGTARSRS